MRLKRPQGSKNSVNANDTKTDVIKYGITLRVIKYGITLRVIKYGITLRVIKYGITLSQFAILYSSFVAP